MLHLLCLKQLQKNSAPALTVLCVTMQAEQREDLLPVRRQKTLLLCQQDCQSYGKAFNSFLLLERVWLLPTAPSFSSLLRHLSSPVGPGQALIPHQPQWPNDWPRAGEKLLLPLLKAAPWDPLLKGAGLMAVLSVSTCHSRPFLSCDVMQEGRGEKKLVPYSFYLVSFLAPILVSLLPAYLHFNFILFWLFSPLSCFILCHHSNARGMYAHLRV